MRILVLPLLIALLLSACGGDNPEQEGPDVRVGAAGEVEGAPYVAYERVSADRLQRGRVVEVGDLRLTGQARRVPAYRLRDEPLSAIRFTDLGAGGWLAWQPSVVLLARRRFAEGEGAQPAQVTTLEVQRVEWPDGCLGIARADVACTQAITPGFRVRLRLGQTQAVFHTDLREQVQRAP